MLFQVVLKTSSVKFQERIHQFFKSPLSPAFFGCHLPGSVLLTNILRKLESVWRQCPCWVVSVTVSQVLCSSHALRGTLALVLFTVSLRQCVTVPGTGYVSIPLLWTEKPMKSPPCVWVLLFRWLSTNSLHLQRVIQVCTFTRWKVEQ